jgi:hypothetical protein
VVACCYGTGWAGTEDFLEGRSAPVLYSVDGETPGDQFGWVVASLGDCDGDGVSDFIAAAPFQSSKFPGGGRVTIHSGATGKRLHAFDGFAGENLGWSVAAASDVDGDGCPDALVGAPGSAAGRAVVLSGRTGKLILERLGEVPGDRFGDKVIGVGDVNGDGRADFAVSAPQHDAAGLDAGRVTLHSGVDGSVLRTWDGSGPGDRLGRSLGAGRWGKGSMLLAGSVRAGGRTTGSVTAWDASSGAVLGTFAGDGAATDLASHFISVAGDTDGDGLADLYISDWMHGARGPVTGRVWILSGADLKPRLELTGGGPGAGFGIGDARAGDVDGDGTADLVIGAWLDSRGAAKGGRVEVRSGRNGTVFGTWTCTRAGDNFGFDATGLGDVNGDGFVDFLATSCGGNAAPSPAGRVWVLSGAALRREPGLATAATFERAAGLLAAGNRSAAAKEARAVVTADAGNATAWHLLGMALHGEGEWKEALKAHLRSTSLPEIAATGYYNAGCAAALLGRGDEAFTHLGRAVAAGFGAVGLIQKDDDLLSVRGDPRMAALVGAMQSRVPPPLPPTAPGVDGSVGEALLGTWDVELVSAGAAGAAKKAPALMGVLRVESIAGGRARLETFTGPSGTGTDSGFTLRVREDRRGDWSAFLHEPLQSAQRRPAMAGRFDAGGGEFRAPVPGGMLRHRFLSVTSERFTWEASVSSDGGASWKVVGLREGRRRASADAIAPPPPATETAFDLSPGTWTGTRRGTDGVSIGIGCVVVPREWGRIEETTTVTAETGAREEFSVTWTDPSSGGRVRHAVGDGAQRFDGPATAAGAGQLLGMRADGSFVRLRWETDGDGVVRRIRETSRDGGARWDPEWTETLTRVVESSPPR